MIGHISDLIFKKDHNWKLIQVNTVTPRAQPIKNWISQPAIPMASRMSNDANQNNSKNSEQ